jgi:hypothetical protein
VTYSAENYWRERASIVRTDPSAPPDRGGSLERSAGEGGKAEATLVGYSATLRTVAALGHPRGSLQTGCRSYMGKHQRAGSPGLPPGRVELTPLPPGLCGPRKPQLAKGCALDIPMLKTNDRRSTEGYHEWTPMNTNCCLCSTFPFVSIVFIPGLAQRRTLVLNSFDTRAKPSGRGRPRTSLLLISDRPPNLGNVCQRDANGFHE